MTLVVVLGVALLGGFIAERLGQPALLGYILAGILIGPHTPGLVTDRTSVELLANLGVAFLMFALGLEFSLGEMLRVRRAAILGGGLQIIGTIAIGALAGRLMRWPLPASLLLGATFAISSSVVAIKLLAGQSELDSEHGRVTLGVGIVQDLSVVPMLALLPLLSGKNDDLGLTLLRSLAISTLALGFVFFVGTRVVPHMLYQLARTGSRELFLMVVVVIALGTGLICDRAGLSFALGAFLAGIAVSSSEFDGQALAQVVPLRDLFATIFFVAVGMLLDPPFLALHLGAVLALVGLLVLGKWFITTGALVLAGVDDRTAALAATALAQMGEFSFVLAGLGLALGIMTADQYGLILSVALASILIVSFLMPVMPRILSVAARWPPLAARQRAIAGPDPGAPPDSLDVLIGGHGRVGAALGQVLEQGGFTYAVVDLNPMAVRRLRTAGVHALYGDIGSEPVLSRAGIAHTRVFAITVTDFVATAAAIRIARQHNPQIRVIAVAAGKGGVRELEASGAHSVVQPEFEASLGLGRQVLRWLGVAAPDTRTVVSGERQAFYARSDVAPKRDYRQLRQPLMAPNIELGIAGAAGDSVPAESSSTLTAQHGAPTQPGADRNVSQAST